MHKPRGHLILILTCLLVFISLSNFVSRYWTEYGFVLFVPLLAAASYYNAELRKQWKKSLPVLKGVGTCIALLLTAILISHLVNGNLGRHEVTELGEYRWLLGIYPLLVFLPFVKNKQNVLGVYFIGITILCLYWSTQYFFFPAGGVVGYPNRLTGFFHSPTDFGHAIQFPLLLALCVALLGKSLMPQLRLSATACLILTSIALVLSYTRASQLACLIAAFSLCFFISRKATIAMIVSALVVFVTIKTTNVLGLWDRINVGTNISETKDYATAERLVLMKANWAVFLDNPVFGVGYHHNQLSLRPYYDKMGLPPGYNEAHAHNQVLNFLAGTGLFGAIAYIVLIAFATILSLKNAHRFQPGSFSKIIAIGTFVMLVGFIIAGLTDSNFELMAAKYNFLLTLSIIVYQRFESKEYA